MNKNYGEDDFQKYLNTLIAPYNHAKKDVATLVINANHSSSNAQIDFAHRVTAKPKFTGRRK